jgi:UDP-N-acetylmuramyl pentapeptide phosphotransferase/UDP-N-acetylglucosamine-1-phosphate transferase
MGGVAVYAGILAGCLAMWFLIDRASISWSLMAITTMLVLGVWDDMKNLPAVPRLIVQFGIVGGYMALTGYHIHNFYGLFGIHEISLWVGIPLSLVGGVGIINAINMIDGIDGYSSGYGIMACTCFAVLFIFTGPPVWSSLAVIVTAALIPFFFHNVFGVKSKMFIGDGGTMMLGLLMSIFAIGALSMRRCPELEAHGIGVIAVPLAVLCIPIFDTLRVMTARMLRGRSPFKPDKSHLHHLFIDMGFSHLGAALFILLINLMVVLSWLLSWHLGASIDMQFYIVVGLGLLVTFGFYRFMKYQQGGGPVDEEGYPLGTALWHAMCKLGAHTRREDRRSWRMMRYLVDGPVFGRIIRK